MDDYGDGGSIQKSSNLQDLEPFAANPAGHSVFDASQYAFFGNNEVEEIELGGLEDDEDDLGAVGFSEEGLQLEREEGDTFGSLSGIDDLSNTFSKAHLLLSGHRREISLGLIDKLLILKPAMVLKTGPHNHTPLHTSWNHILCSGHLHILNNSSGIHINNKTNIITFLANQF